MANLRPPRSVTGPGLRVVPTFVVALVSLGAFLLSGGGCQAPEPFNSPLEVIDGGFETGGRGTGGMTGGSGMTGGQGTGGATGGHATGGATGGNASGGNRTGGMATGGKATGGTATGGAATGGVATGGKAPGGMATGGMATGGMAAGGTATGGMATGGVAAGGAGGSSCFAAAKALCSTCMENGTSLTKKCSDMIDCMVAKWPCANNCTTDCLNTVAGSGVVQTCVTNDLKMCQ